MLSPRLSLPSLLPEAEPDANPSQAEPGNEGLKFPVGFNRLQQKALGIYSPAGIKHKPVRFLHPLLVNHEVVNLPSGSTLAVLRNQVKNRPATSKTLAVIADPIFTRDDPRFPCVQTQPQTPSDAKTTASRACESLDHLEFSGKEAENIIALVPAASRLQALGFDASRAAATRPDLSQYQIVHFSTHGCVSEDHPELSGVALSQFDKTGADQEGFLRLHDMFNLNLPAELVVLSACQTGIGKEVQGEGAIGLTRGFIYAIAKRVVVSLWHVNDAATSQLKYYQQMLQKGLNPV